MISYKRSINILKKYKIIIGNEIVKSVDSINRVTANNIFSKVNYPAGDNAAFDGYALNSKDTKNLSKKNTKLFKIVGSTAAGNKPYSKKIKKFQTIEIMTGGIIPKNFDTIVPIEQINFYPNKDKAKYILVSKKINKYQHVRFKGSDYKKNDLLI